MSDSDINIFVVGDSHAIFYYGSKKIKHHWVAWGELPITMYRFVKEGLPLYNLVERLPKGQIVLTTPSISADMCNINIKNNDYVVFMYGWNDVQKNIYKYSKDNFELMINELVNDYINLIKKYSDGSLFFIKPIISCVYPIPIGTSPNIMGSDDDRIKYTLYMNKKLRMVCELNNIPFFDIYDLISDNNKIKLDVLDKDLKHLDVNNRIIREQIEDRLINICNKFN